jgi:hypothetical protein
LERASRIKRFAHPVSGKATDLATKEMNTIGNQLAQGTPVTVRFVRDSFLTFQKWAVPDAAFRNSIVKQAGLRLPDTQLLVTGLDGVGTVEKNWIVPTPSSACNMHCP